ncbi:hypothetical protein [Novacetimonas pomaceti]|uniref:hypothetical protein n=1 Tax=Novacetimonas pomaceti TaxID=2021998 RepID=UPI0010581199|nr:hypothetical protein [Novacetimonas pomaceti]
MSKLISSLPLRSPSGWWTGWRSGRMGKAKASLRYEDVGAGIIGLSLLALLSYGVWNGTCGLSDLSDATASILKY